MSACGFAIFRITDGTDTVDLIAPTSGFHLFEWTPIVADLKGGGVWQDSPLADGRRPSLAHIDNVIESISLKVNGFSQDSVILDTQRLRRLLKKARDYWTSQFSTEPVWIERKAIQETRTGYAVIMNARAVQDDNPFFQPFFPSSGRVNSVAMDEFELLVEREPLWRYEEPGTVSAVALSVIQTFNGITLGNVDSTGTREPTTDDEVFFVNKHNVANLTHVFVDDGGAFSANMLSAALPHILLPAVPVVNDAIYFISSTAITGAGLFSNVVLDIGTAATGITIAWEYWDSAAWSAIGNMMDNTSGFSVTGVKSVAWPHPDDWATTTINGVTGYIVRGRVATAVGATGATQQNRDVYSVTWPYVEVQDTALKGDWPSLLRLRVRNQSYNSPDGNTQIFDRIIVGARGVDRGENFTAIIPISDVQTPSGITVSSAHAIATFVNEIELSSTGRAMSVSSGSPYPLADRVQVTLDNTIASHFYGRFHAYVRIHVNSGGSTFTLQLRALTYSNLTNQFWQSRVFANKGEDIGGVSDLDMGVVTLPPGEVDASEDLESIVFLIRTSNSSIYGSDLLITDLILIPVDEWSLQAEDTQILGITHLMTTQNYIDLDGATHPKRPAYAPIRTRSTDRLEMSYKVVSPVQPQIASQRRTRVWFITGITGSAGDESFKYNRQFCLNSVQMSAVQRYESQIGGGTQ